MKYAVRINKRVRNVHVYRMMKKTRGNVNVFTKLFLRIFASKERQEEKKEEKIKM